MAARSTGTPETSLQRTYQYLRIGIGAAALLIGFAVIFDVLATGELRSSISDYYNSPARNVFVGALVAVSLGLFAISGNGVERVLLDAAAMFAPLIALVPAPRVGVDHSGAVDNAVKAYFAMGVLLLVFAIVLRWRKSVARIEFEDPRGFTTSIVIGAVWLAALGILYCWFREAFLLSVHYISAGTFFVIIAVVAFLQAALGRRYNRKEFAIPDDEPVPASPGQTVFYTIVAVALPVDVIALLAVALLGFNRTSSIPGSPVLWLEAIALGLFAAFWFVQSYQKRGQGNPTVTASQIAKRNAQRS